MSKEILSFYDRLNDFFKEPIDYFIFAFTIKEFMIPTNEAVMSGIGKPSFVKRPTPWFAKTNFIIPSHRNTAPAMKRIKMIAEVPVVGG